MTQDTSEILRSMAEAWTASLDQILESMTDQKPTVDWKAGPAPAGEGLFWWEQSLSLEDSPLLWVAAPPETWNELGGRTLRAAGVETVEPDDARNTYLEILSQSLSGLVQWMSERIGREVSCAKGGACEAPSAEATWITAEVHYGEAAFPLHAGFAVSLLTRVAQPPEEAPAPEPADEPAGVAGSMAPAFQPHTSKTLDLLLDVELPVSVSFGRAELPLKDVLKLTTGSIVELNRGISEPVEVIVNNCVVARGEVVVMDGNYGVRIHQIISAQERLRTLK